MAKIPQQVKAELIWAAALQLRIWLRGWLARRKKPQPKEVSK